MQNADVRVTPLRRKQSESIDTFVVGVEASLAELGVQNVAQLSPTLKMYQIPRRGGIFAGYGNSARMFAKNTTVTADGFFLYLGVTEDTVQEVQTALAKSGYYSE